MNNLTRSIFNTLRFTSLKTSKESNFKLIRTIPIVLLLCLTASLTYAQNYELVTVNSVATGSGTNNALFNVSSPTIPSLAHIRAERISGPADGNFQINGDNIRYRITSATAGIPNNYSRIRFTFLQADGITPIPVNDFRFVINDIDGPNNEALATDCGSNVRFSATAIPTNLNIDNTPPDLNATGTQNENDGPTSRIMYEFNDIAVIEFDNYANQNFLKDFDLNDNDFPIDTPLYTVCLGDNDGDNITDDIDLDDDNDGILDVVEADGNDPNGDHDGDGLPNYLDIEDNTGDHPTYTANADGTTTIYTDSDGDGVPDIYEASADADSIPNHLDNDSDNDGCPDVNEVYGAGTDTDSNGYYGAGIPAVDANGLVIAAGVSGAVYTTLPSDQDANSVDDYLQASIALVGITTQPTDNLLVSTNSNQTFTVVANTSGTGTPVSYQWQLDSGTGFNNLANGGVYSGVNTATLSLTGVTNTIDGYSYRVVLTTPSYVCDTDYTTTAAIITFDSDGDGDPDTTDPNPSDPCNYTPGSIADTNDAVWQAGDCDGDGVTNGGEDNDGTDPKDDCSFLTGSISITVTSTGDCDGDGVTNADEDNDGTDPKDDCSFLTGSVSVAVTSTSDCDGDGVTNADEDNDGTDPKDDCSFLTGSVSVAVTSTSDCDGDGVTNADEDNDGTDPQDDCSFLTGSVSVAITSTGDCDGDGVTNEDENNDGTDPLSSCSFNNGSITLPVTSTGNCDEDGDGVTNNDEIADGTDPTNPCEFNPAHITLTPSLAWSNGDCDNDNVLNGEEFLHGDTDGDNIPDYLDTDDDNDGVDTVNEDYGDTDLSDGNVDATGDNDPTNDDSDNDGTPDYLDEDDDGDGILTIDENPDPNDDGNGFGNDAFDSDGDSLSDYLEVNDIDLSNDTDELEIFNAVTPDGDENNGVFTIRNIELYPNNELHIFNRWGVEVYNTKGYGQDGKYFSGESGGRITIQQNEKLPVGTYFYVLSYKNNQGTTKKRSGYLYIQR